MNIASSEVQSFSDGGSRQRLFSIYSLTVIGLVATALLAGLVLAATDGRGLRLPFGGLAISVLISAIIFVAVMRVSVGLDSSGSGVAKFLLFLVPISNALLACTFPGMFGGEVREIMGLLTATFLIVSGSIVVILPVNILIGFNGGAGQTVFRWMVNIAIIFLPVVLIESDWWWVGLIGGIVFAKMVDSLFRYATENPQIPSPALAACLVAGVGFLVLFITYLIIRFIMRLFVVSADAAIQRM